MHGLLNHRLPAALAGALAACLAGGAVLASGAVGGGASARAATSFTINCNKGQKIGKTLAGATAVPRVSITFSGVCREKVVIARDNVTLRAANAQSSIQLPVAPVSSVSLRIVDARGILLQQVQVDGGGTGLQIVNSSVAATGVRITDAARGLSVEPGSVMTFNGGLIGGISADGVDVYDGAVLTSDRSTFENTGSDGIAVIGGQAKLTNCKIRGNDYEGVEVSSAGRASFEDCVVEHNTYAGIHANWGGVAEIRGGNVSFNNDGVIAQSGDVLLVGTTVSSNSKSGVTGATGARVTVAPGTVISSNGGNGLWLLNGSVGEIAGSVTFHANGQDGVHIADNSSIWLESGDNTFTNNTNWGIHCAASPATALVHGSPADMGTVSGNGGGAAACNFTQG